MFHNVQQCIQIAAEPQKICRGTWFKGSSNDSNWVPISEEEAGSIEASHQALWRSMVLYVNS